MNCCSNEALTSINFQESSLNSKNDEKIALDIDLGEEYEVALGSASTDEIVDLAGILGLHSMMNQVSIMLWWNSSSFGFISPRDPEMVIGSMAFPPAQKQK